MQVFKAFIKTAFKSFPSIMLYFIIFTSLALLMAYAYTDTTSSSFKSVELQIGIVDKDHSAASAALSEYLDSMHELISLENQKEVLLDRLFYRDVEYILVIPEGFEDNLLSGKDTNLFETVQIPGIYSSAFVDQQINSYLKTVKLYLSGGYSLEDALSHSTDTFLDTANNVQIVNFNEDTQHSASLVGIFSFYQFIPYVLASMILCGLTPILTTFWQKDLAKRISCSSTSLISRNLQLALGSVTYAFFNWGLFILTSRIFYGAEVFSEKGLLCILNSLMLLPLSVALSLIISSFSPSWNATNMINNILSLGMSFICGVFIPQSQLGENVLAVAKFLPFYWYIKNNDLISGSSDELFTYTAYWQNIGVQLLFIGALFAIALVASKMRLARQEA
ncbi:MAG: ABC transporter permease [Lachnospiraceae bacterium]|nr:ABC transporter permease [Lachnospiraceae bacterium]